VVLLNYRGSTGFGEASIQSLPGRIGTADVADCLASLQAAVDAGGAGEAGEAGGAAERDATKARGAGEALAVPWRSSIWLDLIGLSLCAHSQASFPSGAGLADPERVAVIGGSHGGFLTGHLVGQHPERFKCAVLRNPVCDISLMVHGEGRVGWTRPARKRLGGPVGWRWHHSLPGSCL
jgi:hypothetical protein